jgi:RHH-type transcriptional regulator, proline utilization regulon repressor / proline dehydrogenase / delta 1-pyrroline-5-carboxylate dehydrogenase
VLMSAAEITGTPVIWSDPTTESDDMLASRLADTAVERLRLPDDATPVLLAAAHAAGIAVDSQPVTDIGDIELGRWMKEQSVSITRHRHGRLLR